VAYYLSPSLAALRAQANTRYPDRDKSSDGWIGDTSHAARKSDHNPDWDAGGVVRAYDLDEDLDGNGLDHGAELMFVAEHLRVTRDPRVKYVIYEGRMFASYDSVNGPAWKWRPYAGANAHRKHVHVSVLPTRTGETDTRPWFPAAAPIIPEDPHMSAQDVANLHNAIRSDLLRLASFVMGGRTNAVFNQQSVEDLDDVPGLADVSSLNELERLLSQPRLELISAAGVLGAADELAGRIIDRLPAGSVDGAVVKAAVLDALRQGTG